jgi:hypothetical protein
VTRDDLIEQVEGEIEIQRGALARRMFTLATFLEVPAEQLEAGTDVSVSASQLAEISGQVVAMIARYESAKEMSRALRLVDA